MKNLTKKILYTFHKPRLPDGEMHLGYIFHTEQIYNQDLFSNLLKFCEAYRKLSSKKPICALMSGVNPLVVEGMKAHGVSAEVYVNRARQLSEVSTLGYHGHFWSDLTKLHDTTSQIKGHRPHEPALIPQFENDLQWFKSNGLNHNGIYSGGWWFMSEQVQKLLIQNGFTLDFTLSKAPHFRNPYSQDLMQFNQIRVGECIKIENKLLCIQNFIGCHTTPFVEDFFRNMRNLFVSDGAMPLQSTGVVNSHDYDLDVPHTLGCVEALTGTKSVRFCDAQDFRNLASRNADQIKSVSLHLSLGKPAKSSEPQHDHQTLE